MNERHCHRCDSILHIASEGALLYCSNCGAPQLVLSEELQDQAVERQRLERQSTEEENQLPRSTHSLSTFDWRLVIRLSLIVCGALSALSILLPQLGLLVIAWAPVSPAIVISLYATRARSSRLTGSFGARVGLLCGSFIVVGLALLNTLFLDFVRFVMHRPDFDNSVDALLSQVRAQTIAQSGPQAAGLFDLLSVPEFRAGFFLAGFGLMAAFVLLLTTGGGALAGTFRKRRSVS